MDLESISQPMKAKMPTDQKEEDARDLAELGHEQELTRKFNMWSMSALSFCVLGTYSVFAQDLSSGLTNGGPITILWGLLLVTACNLCVGVSLGELASSMPTALGQAYWVYRLWGTPLGRFASYMCAWINTFGWWTLSASMVAFMAEFLLRIYNMVDPNWDSGRGWLNFVVYLGLTFLLTFTNAIGCRREQVLPWINNFVGLWFVALFVILSLALLISVGINRDRLSFQPASFVFGQWINETGWSDGVVWFTGLVQAAYGLTAFDSVIHMIEEMPAPRRNAPRIIWMSIVFGAVTGFLFMIVCLFCIQDVKKVVSADLPFIQLMLETVGLKGGLTLMSLFIFNGVGQGVGVFATGSRLTWGFARDGGLPWSRYLSHVDRVWKVPARALWTQAFLVGLVGVLYLFSNTVLQAILSVSTVALTVSYTIPILSLLVIGLDRLPRGPFHLGRWGTTINWISLIYCAITTVFFLFPYTSNPSPADMNYAVAVFGVMLVISIAFWFIQGKRTYLRTDDAFTDMREAQQLERSWPTVVDVPAEQK